MLLKEWVNEHGLEDFEDQDFNLFEECHQRLQSLVSKVHGLDTLLQYLVDLGCVVDREHECLISVVHNLLVLLLFGGNPLLCVFFFQRHVQELDDD